MFSFVNRSCFVLGALVSVLLAVGTPAQAATFSVPQQINPGPYAGQIGLGMDAAGNAIINFTGGGSFYSTHAAGGAWSAPATVYSGAGGFWNMLTTPAGAATIVSYSSLAGIYWIDRAPGGAWSAPNPVIPGQPQLIAFPNMPQAQVVGNARGDQAIVFEWLGPTGLTISAVRRFALGAWGPEETVATSTAYGPIQIGSVALGGNGDLLVAFEPYVVACGTRSCHQIDYTVHAAREGHNGTTWVDSGVIFPTSTYAYTTQAVLDAAGHAGLLATALFFTTIESSTQARAGSAWSAPAAATGAGYLFSAGSPSIGAGADIALQQGGPGGFAATILHGSLTKNTWPITTVLSAYDSQTVNYGLSFAESASGTAVAAWTDSDGTVRATTRTARGVWAAPQTIATGGACGIGGFACTAVAAVAVDVAGRAVVAFTQANYNNTYTGLFVSAND